MTRETKIGLLVGLAFIILFGIILSEKGTGRNDQLATPPIAAFPPVVELVPPTAAPAAPLTRNNGSTKDAADRLTMTEPGVKVTDQTAPSAPVNNDILKPVETVAPVKEAGMSEPDIAPTLKPLLPPNKTKSLTQIPANNPTAYTAQVVNNATAVGAAPVATIAPEAVTEKPAPIEVAEAKTHTLQHGETLASVCRQYYPGQAYEMLKKVKEYNKIARPEKLMVGQVIKLPPTDKATAPKTTRDAAVALKDPKAKSTALASSDLLTPVDDADSDAMLNPTTGKIVRVKATATDKEAEKTTLKGKALTEAKSKPTDPTAKTIKPASKTYVVQNKDTLMKIARRLYGSDKAWTKIYELNKKAIPDPKNLKSGLKLKMPTGPGDLAVGPKVE